MHWNHQSLTILVRVEHGPQRTKISLQIVKPDERGQPRYPLVRTTAAKGPWASQLDLPAKPATSFMVDRRDNSSDNELDY